MVNSWEAKSEEEAFEMIQSLQGRSHMVYTGVAIIVCKEGVDEEDGGVGFDFRIENHAVGTKVNVVSMTEKEIWDYIKSGDPMAKAGAYGIQGEFAKHVKWVEEIILMLWDCGFLCV